MNKILGAIVVIGLGVIIYSQYKKDKKELKNVTVKK
jgi:hypothetical protein